MKRLVAQRTAALVVLSLSLISFGCNRRPPVAPAPVAGPPAPPPPTPTIVLSADRTAINSGQSVTLSYTATNATAVTIQPGVGAVQPATSGTRVVNPTALTTYTATATGPGGTATSAGVTVSVAQPQPPPPPPVAAPPTPPPVARPPVSTAPPPSAATIFAQTMVPIYFDYDKSNIRPDQESTLLSEAAYLKMNAALRFTVEGHADERGSQEYNIALGDERAAAVKKYLVDQGVAESRISTVSYGEERPVCREEGESCWQRNRRGAFTLNP
jgi:peptidoglycan-associated lipoprotein